MKVVFWNVDTQYDFMRDDESYKGLLPVPDAREIESNLDKLTKFAEDRGITVVNTADWHNEKSAELSDTPDFKTTFPKHCMMGTKGAEYVPATKPKNPYVIDWQGNGFDEKKVAESRNILMYKDAFDIFSGNKNADKVWEIIQPDLVVVYGVAEQVCDDFAVMGNLARKAQVWYVPDAMKGLPNIPSPADKWKAEGANPMYTAQVLEELMK